LLFIAFGCELCTGQQIFFLDLQCHRSVTWLARYRTSEFELGSSEMRNEVVACILNPLVIVIIATGASFGPKILCVS
jgi:hypothetical protein